MNSLRVVIASFAILFHCFALAAQGEPLMPDKAAGIKFKGVTGTKIKVKGNSVDLTASRDHAGLQIEGIEDLRGYKSLKFRMTNHDEKRTLFVYFIVVDSTYKGYPRYTHVPELGKAQGHASIFPGETRTVEFKFPAAVPRPDINQTFYDNWVIGRARNTPYSYGYGLYSYDVDLGNVKNIRIAARHLKEGMNFTIDDITLVPGKRTVPDWMKYKKDKFFPFIDRYGQFKHTVWDGKVTDDSQLKEAAALEEKDLEANPRPSSWSRYGGWKDGPRYEATGHFRVEKIDGKWWMIDPEGYLFWSHGVVRVNPSSAVTPLDGHRFYFEDLPQDPSDPFYQFYFTKDELLHPYYVVRGIKETYDFSSANLYRKYGEDYKEIYSDLAHRRLHSWGMNVIANSSEKSICLMDRTVYNDRVDLAAPVEGYPQWRILPGAKGIWDFTDPYDELFPTCVRAHLEKEKRKLDDPWCQGMYVDNEIKWGKQDFMPTLALKAPADQPMKKALIGWLQERYRTVAELNSAWGSSYSSWEDMASATSEPVPGAKTDLEEFGLQVVEKYFSTVRRVFKEVAPQKLYMGCRFAGAPQYVVRIGAKYCDVMSYNRYVFSLLDFNLGEGLDRPVMIGEFHFGAMNRGMFHPGLVYCEDQERRARAYRDYLVSALENPCIIGTNWHQFSDQATSGRFDGENINVGLTDVCDTPYPELRESLRHIGRNMYDIRYNAGREEKGEAVLEESVTYMRLQSLPVDLPQIGTLQPVLPSVDKESWWSVGCETLDRNLSEFDDYRHLIAQTCAGYVRLQSGWAKTEKVKGKYDFSWLDEQVDYLLSQGVKPWLCLCYGNPLYEDEYADRNLRFFPVKEGEAMNGWCRYVEAVVKHFKGRISMFELWNEPDLRKGTTSADYARFLMHTVRAVKLTDLQAKVAVGVVSKPETPYAAQVLHLLSNMGLASYVDYVTFHAYFPNPDLIADVAVGLREQLRQFNPDIRVLQGEAGCVSMPMFDGGFSNRDWDEVAQVKWDTRQMLTCFRVAVPTSVFTMVDYVYNTYFVSYGMLRLDLNKKPVYLKPKFYGVRNVASVVTADCTPSDKVKVVSADCPEEITIVGMDKGERTVGYFMWFGGALPSKETEKKYVTCDVAGARLKDPVYVDMLTGKVYSLEEMLCRGSVSGDVTHYGGLPLWDAPILVIERDEIKFDSI